MPLFTNVSVVNPSNEQSVIQGATASGGTSEGDVLVVRAASFTIPQAGLCFRISGEPGLDLRGVSMSYAPAGLASYVYFFTVDNAGCSG